MDLAETKELLKTYLQQSAVELFGDIGAQFDIAQASDWTPDVTSIVGIAGSGIAGSVALSTSSRCLVELAQLGNASIPEDWLGELSNQLVGRFKRRLVPHGASFGLGTPVVLTGEHLRLAARSIGGSLLTLWLDSKIGRAVVWVDIEFRDGFELTAQTKDDGTLIEGEALLF